jgi:type IV pilus assembly protein PilP
VSLKKRRNSLILLLFFVAAIPVFLGIIRAQAAEKAVLKIQKDKKEIAEPSKKPGDKEKDEAAAMEGSEKKDIEKERYVYDPTGKVDPFKSFIVMKKELEEKERGEPKTYLETLDISQLTVSAIVLSDKDSWALVRDSKGEGHVIRVGTPLGNNRGIVTRILEKEVVVREYSSDIRGREIVRDISMKLPLAD